MVEPVDENPEKSVFPGILLGPVTETMSVPFTFQTSKSFQTSR